MKKLESVLLKPAVAAFLVITIFIVSFSFIIINSVVNDKFNDLIESVLISKQNEIELFLTNKINEIERLSNIYDEKLNIQENLKKFSYINEVTQAYESVGIVDGNGEIVLNTGVSFSISNRDYYQVFINEKLDKIISDLIISKENDEKIVIFLKALNDEKTLSVAVNVNYIYEVINGFDEFNFPIQIVDKEDGVIMQSGEKLINAIVYEATLKANENWKLRIFVPKSFFYTTIVIINISFLMVAVLAFIMASFFMKFQIKKSIKPLDDLSLKMSHIDKQFDEIKLESSILEIDKLANSYNQMIFKIKSLIKEIEKVERDKKDSDYQALLEQIKPHFLYNTLETIQSMAIDYDDDKLEQAISMLGKYFRLSLSGHLKFISINDELMLAASYIELQKLRYGDKLNLIVCNELNKDYKILKFTIQPLLENAIYHGVKQISDKSNIAIRVFEKDEKIKIIIINETVGKKKDSEKINDALVKGIKLKGNGLYNVNERLKLHYNENCIEMMQIENKVQVIITLPKIEVKNEHFSG